MAGALSPSNVIKKKDIEASPIKTIKRHTYY